MEVAEVIRTSQSTGFRIRILYLPHLSHNSHNCAGSENSKGNRQHFEGRLVDMEAYFVQTSIPRLDIK